jgi:hypothetical protein
METEEILHFFAQDDTSNCLGILDAKQFREKLLHVTRESLNEHEVITICRAFKVEAPTPPPDMRTLQ